MNALVPCHWSTPKSTSKPSVIVYQGISQPIRALTRSMSGCGPRETKARVVFRCVQVGDVGDLVGDHRAADAPVVGPAVHTGIEERAVHDQLLAALEEIEEAGGTGRAVELVGRLDRRPRHPAPLGGHGVAGLGQLLLLDEQAEAGGLPVLGGHDRRGLHGGLLSGAVVRMLRRRARARPSGTWFVARRLG